MNYKEMYNGAKDAAYRACKRFFKSFVEVDNLCTEKKNDYYTARRNEALYQYIAACEMYDAVFGEDFTLTDEDRKSILGEESSED